MIREDGNWQVCLVFPLFQIVSCFDLFRYIVFTIYLDIIHIKMRNRSYVSRKVNLNRTE